jgi:serine protease Do
MTPTAGGVVFFGDIGGNFYVLDAANGQKLWSQELGGAIGGGVITYTVNGAQKVAVASGFTNLAWPTKIVTAKMLVEWGIGHVNKGNSGGPAFNMQGEVVGVNTAIYSPSGGSVGIAFSIPAATVKSVIGQLKDKGTVSRGWIGVQIQPVTQDIADSLGLKQAEGALVAEPQSDGPAAKAGIEPGDIVTAVNGQPIKDARELARIIGGFAPGNAVKLDVLHKGNSKVVGLTLGQLPNVQEAKPDTDADAKGSTRGIEVPRLGLTLAPASKLAGEAKKGVVVTKVDPKSAAADRGFKEGDVILEVAGKSVANPGDVREAIEAARTDKKNSVLMRLRSGDASHYVAVPLANG